MENNAEDSDMQCKTIVGTMAFLMAGVLSGTASATEYVYIDYAQTAYGNGSEGFALHYDTDRLRFMRGHSGHNFWLCDASESYVCFYSVGDHFAVPKAGALEVGDEWTQEGHKFVVAREQTISLWGRSEPVSI